MEITRLVSNFYIYDQFGRRIFELHAPWSTYQDCELFLSNYLGPNYDSQRPTYYIVEHVSSGARITHFAAPQPGKSEPRQAGASRAPQPGALINDVQDDTGMYNKEVQP